MIYRQHIKSDTFPEVLFSIRHEEIIAVEAFCNPENILRAVITYTNGDTQEIPIEEYHGILRLNDLL